MPLLASAIRKEGTGQRRFSEIMGRTDIEKQVGQLCHNMKQNYEDLLEDFSAEAIHDFRVEIKKLRAYLRLLNAGRTAEKKAKLPSELRSFYRLVGDLRSLQVQRDLMLRWCNDLHCIFPVRYVRLLHQKETELQAKARSMALELSMDNLHGHLLNVAGKPVDTAAVDNFVALKKHLLVKYLLMTSYRDEDLHSLRKELKDVLYVWPLVESAMEDAFPDNLMTRDNCVYLCEKLGEYQDLCTAQHLLDPSFTEAVNDKEEREVLHTLLFYGEDLQDELKQEIAEVLAFMRREIEKKDLLFELYQIL